MKTPHNLWYDWSSHILQTNFISSNYPKAQLDIIFSKDLRARWTLGVDFVLPLSMKISYFFENLTKMWNFHQMFDFHSIFLFSKSLSLFKIMCIFVLRFPKKFGYNSGSKDIYESTPTHQTTQPPRKSSFDL